MSNKSTKSHSSRRYGYVVASVITLLPVLLWAILRTGPSLMESPSAVLGALGKAAAIAGLAAYCLMPVLSMRHAFFEKLLGGMDVLYKLHRQIGKLVFFVIWAHPILLVGSRLLAGRGLVTVWDWASVSVLLGIFALIGFTAVTAITVYAHIKHQKWITVHRFFGWLLPVAFAHGLLSNAQIVHIKPLLIYMILLGAAGFIAFLYRSVFVHFVTKYPYEIKEVNLISPTVTELVLKPTKIPITYNPGQYAYLSVESPEVDDEAHPFSFTTAANGPYVRFVIKELGDDTTNMKKLEVGTKAFLEGPYGHFSYHDSNNTEQVWIAGGVGLTPFLSLARSLSATSKYKIHLFYAAEKLEDAVFLRELLSIRRWIPDVLNLTVVNRDLSGFVTIDLLKGQLPDVTKPDYLICGPPPMLKKLKSDLLANKVDPDQIITEEFSML